MTARKYPRGRTLWTSEDIAYLMANYGRIGGVGCSATLQRSPAACTSRAFHLGLTIKYRYLRPPKRLYMAALNVAADATGVHVDHLLGRSRIPKFSRARWQAWKTLYDTGIYSLTGIGYVAGYDHSSIYHGLRRLGAA